MDQQNYMREGSLKHRIHKFPRSQPGMKINGGEIERLAQEHGYKAENGDRRARELAAEGKKLQLSGKEGGYVLSEEIKGPTARSIWFTYIPSKYETYYKQHQERNKSV